MAPKKPVVRTYGKSNKSINSVDAFNKLFVKNLTKRKLNKIQIKKLPERIKSILSNDSIDVTTNNTFDRLLKEPLLNDVQVKNINKNISTNVTIHSPILTRSRKFRRIEDSMSFTKELTKNTTNSISISRLKQATQSNERIDQSLFTEKEKEETSLQRLRSSKTYLKIPHIELEDSTAQKVDGISLSNKIFTNSLREAITVHSSTPVTRLKTKYFIKHPISPIKSELEKVVEKSFEEVKQWDNKFPPKDSSVIRSNNSLTKLEDFLGFTNIEQTCNSTNLLSNEIKRDSFIELRSRKIHKSSSRNNSSNKLCPVTEKTSNSKSFSLEEFENFQMRHCSPHNSNTRKDDKTAQNKSDSSYPLHNFEEFVSNYTSSLEHSPIDKCRNISYSRDFDLSASSYIPRAAKKFPDNYFVTHRRPRISFLEQRLCKQFGCKELAVELPKLPLSLCNNESVNISKLITKELFVNLESSLMPRKMCSPTIFRNLVVNLTYIGPICDKTLPHGLSENNADTNLNVASITKSDDDSTSFFEPNLPDTNLNVASIIKSDDDSRDDSTSFFEPNLLHENSIITYTISDESSTNTVSDTDHSATELFKEISQNLENANLEKELIVKLEKNSILTITPPHTVSGERNERLIKKPDGYSKLSITNSLGADSKSIDDAKFLFKAPLPIAKTPLHLKSGKLWRRSLLTHRRETLQDAVSTPVNANSTAHRIKRESIRIVPSSEDMRKKSSLLEKYAKLSLSNLIEEEEESKNTSPQTYTTKKVRSLSTGILKHVPVVSAQDIVLNKCDQNKVLPFETCYSERLLEDCRKIGEGVYGEVFLYTNRSGGTTVMKVIPVEGDQMVNGDRQKKFEEILSEIVITKELSNLRSKKDNYTSSFTEVQRVCCVHGEYPQRLLDLWNTYNQVKGSENDCPDIFKADQQYIVLDLGNGGRDLEAFVFNNAVQALAVFQQVACALAVAEEELKFEHRDLHWGNVLVTEVDKNDEILFRLNGKEYNIQTKGVCSTIIDFTLSRVECDGVTLFNDLSQDPELFTSEGDYQFDIYRLMQKRNGNEWQKFEPYSNILWLHYILDKAIGTNGLRYKNVKSKIHKDYLGKLRGFKNKILNYCSVKEFVTSQF